MYERVVQNEFLLPSCLPIGHRFEEAFHQTDNDEVLYLDFGGLLSPNFFPSLGQKMQSVLEQVSKEWQPGPPQFFRNRGEFHSSNRSVFTALIPVSAESNSKSLLRILVKGVCQESQDEEKRNNRGVSQEVKQLFFGSLGFAEMIDLNPTLFFELDEVAEDKKNFERTFARTPCLKPKCGLSCSLCRMQNFLQERYLHHLSPELRSIVERATFFPRHTRPAGSFRFDAAKFPGDVDLEEYLVINAGSSDEALQQLCLKIQEKIKEFSCSNDCEVFFGGLTAGRLGNGEAEVE